jgi:hypothetical protein
MSQTRDSATPSPEHGPIFEEPEPEHITQEQFNDELDKGLAEMLIRISPTRKREKRGEQERLLEAMTKKMMMMKMTMTRMKKRHMKVPRILSHVKSHRRQQKRSYIRILTRMRK